MARRRLVERARRRQLGRRLKQPCHDQRQRQVASPLGTPRQQPIEPDPPRRSQRCRHVSVRQRAHDLQTLACRHQLVAAQHGAQLLNPLRRPVGQVLQRPILDLVAVAIALPQ
jgi:hypothetical protein